MSMEAALGDFASLCNLLDESVWPPGHVRSKCGVHLRNTATVVLITCKQQLCCRW